MNLLKRTPAMSEISQYVADLESITNLRDRVAKDPELRDEVERYDTIIEVMQLVLIGLNR